MKKQKILFWILVVALFALMFMGCSELRTGFYKVEEVRGKHTIVLKGVAEPLYFPTDTLKVGDRVYVQRAKRQDHANIW